MEVHKDLISTGQGVRTGKKLSRCLGLVVHWIGVAQGHAEVIRNNFGRSECGTHYISDWYDGHIIQCVPEDEVCYHVGGSRYTDLKKRLCGSANPNWYFVGVECCIDPATKIPADYGAAGKYLELGRPSDKQYAGLVELAADFLTRHGLGVESLYRHYDITGKVCHAWFVKDAARWEKFKADVARKMKGDTEMDEDKIKSLVREIVAQELAERDAVQAETVQRVSSWAKESWAKAVSGGVFDGTRPGGGQTREMEAVVLDRLGLLE